jgi:hypothetical protein
MKPMYITQWVSAATLSAAFLFGQDAAAWKRLGVLWNKASPVPSCAPQGSAYKARAIGYFPSSLCTNGFCQNCIVETAGSTNYTTNGQCSASDTKHEAQVWTTNGGGSLVQSGVLVDWTTSNVNELYCPAPNGATWIGTASSLGDTQ